ncbi:MAG: dual specificity protein phosphatase family protein [Nitrososphaerota archaeon]|jgi:hypothetical protein|nr:dual specificity protein phosphatase family protein [Nitrososphaerota archaeon]MDG6948628.1 dual specificity protein phosphatase family protein [Nitrososphaerota archaeon]
MESPIFENLFLGDYLDAMKWSENSLGRIICVITEKPPHLLPNSVWVPIMDIDCGSHTIDDIKCRANVAALEAVSNTIDMILDSGERVLVHCALGRDRSPLAVAWYLHQKARISLDKAYEIVKSCRPMVYPHPNWVSSIEVDGKTHLVGDKDCHEGWCGGSYNYPRPCGRQGCEGLVHAEFGDEDSNCNYWLHTKCDKCGEPEAK